MVPAERRLLAGEAFGVNTAEARHLWAICCLRQAAAVRQPESYALHWRRYDLHRQPGGDLQTGELPWPWLWGPTLRGFWDRSRWRYRRRERTAPGGWSKPLTASSRVGWDEWYGALSAEDRRSIPMPPAEKDDGTLVVCSNPSPDSKPIEDGATAEDTISEHTLRACRGDEVPRGPCGVTALPLDSLTGYDRDEPREAERVMEVLGLDGASSAIHDRSHLKNKEARRNAAEARSMAFPERENAVRHSTSGPRSDLGAGFKLERNRLRASR
jgi:hypothetical protein